MYNLIALNEKNLEKNKLKCNNIDSADKNKQKIDVEYSFKNKKLKSRVSSIQFKPQHSLKTLLLPNPMWLLNYILNSENNFSFFIFQSILPDTWINCNQISEDLLYSSIALIVSHSTFMHVLDPDGIKPGILMSFMH